MQLVRMSKKATACEEIKNITCEGESLEKWKIYLINLPKYLNFFKFIYYWLISSILDSSDLRVGFNILARKTRKARRARRARMARRARRARRAHRARMARRACQGM